jgi:hypothetical protein
VAGSCDQFLKKHIEKMPVAARSTVSVSDNHQKRKAAQASSSSSRAARCSLNLLREAEVLDWRRRAAAGKILLPGQLFNPIFVRSRKKLT